jgi:hypothetical protein
MPGMHWDLPGWLAGWLLIVPPIDLPCSARPPAPAVVRVSVVFVCLCVFVAAGQLGGWGLCCYWYCFSRWA